MHDRTGFLVYVENWLVEPGAYSHPREVCVDVRDRQAGFLCLLLSGTVKISRLIFLTILFRDVVLLFTSREKLRKVLRCGSFEGASFYIYFIIVQRRFLLAHSLIKEREACL